MENVYDSGIYAMKGIEICNAVCSTVHAIPFNKRYEPCASVLKQQQDSENAEEKTSKYADAEAERVGLKILESLAEQTCHPISLILDINNSKTRLIGKEPDDGRRVYTYFDAVDGTVSVAGLGGGQYSANSGNWGIGIAFTVPTSKSIDDLVIGDFIVAIAAEGNTRKHLCNPCLAVVRPGDWGNSYEMITIDAAGYPLRTSDQTKINQTFCYYDSFQAFDRETNGCELGKICQKEALAKRLFGHLINRHDGGFFGVKSEYGSISACVANMLGWEQPNMPKSQGGAFLSLNENLANLIPLVPIIEGAGGIATDFDGNPLAQRKLTSGRPDVILAANETIHKGALNLVKRAKDEVKIGLC